MESNIEYYALATKQSQVYGHGDNGEEFHICPVNAYHTNSREFHPLFTTEEEAKTYIDKLDSFGSFEIVKLKLNK